MFAELLAWRKKTMEPDKPIEIERQLRRLQAELDDAIWDGSDPDKIKYLRRRIEIVKLKLELGEKYDASH